MGLNLATSTEFECLFLIFWMGRCFGRILSKLIPSCIKHKVLEIVSHRVFLMKNLQKAGIDSVFFWINLVEKCSHSFLWCYVNRGKVTSQRLLVTRSRLPIMVSIHVVNCEIFLSFQVKYS
jgi:hypothetical protein